MNCERRSDGMKKKTRKSLETVAKLLASIAATLIGLAELLEALK